MKVSIMLILLILLFTVSIVLYQQTIKADLPTKTKYFLVGGLIVIVASATIYSVYKQINNNSPLPQQWACLDGECLPSDCKKGSTNCYDDSNCGGQCNNPTGKPLNVTCLFSIPNPYDPADITTLTNVNTWFIDQVNRSNKDDIMYLWTDYTAYDDEMKDAINKAVGRGAKLILGIDRTQCGGSSGYTCGADDKTNWCCFDDGAWQPSCETTFLKGTHCCQTWRSILQLPNVALQCGKNVIPIDTKDDSGEVQPGEKYRHSHRKICVFYRKGTSAIYKGSWNISTRNQLEGGLRESGVGIVGDISSDMFQYALRTDVDTLTFLLPAINDQTNGKKAIAMLQNKLTGTTYPSIPIKSDISWTGPDPSNPSGTISGFDKDMEIWVGVSPSPNKPQKAYAGKFMKDVDINKVDWADGNLWGGTVLQKFFDSAKKDSNYVKMQMYEPNMDAADPAQKAFSSWLDFIPLEMVDFIKTNSKNSVETILGYFAEPGSPDPNSTGNPKLPPGKDLDSQNDLLNWWFIQSIEDGTFKLTPEQKKQLYFRFFQTKDPLWPNAHYCNDGGKCAYYKDCTECWMGKGSENICCKAHDKLYISAVGVNFASGHWVYGYYNDILWANDDILFLNSTPSTPSTFAAYWTNWFNVEFTLNTLPPDQNPMKMYPDWDRTAGANAPPAFNCHVINDAGRINDDKVGEIDTLNCFPNFPTTFSTEDIYAKTSYGSWDPPFTCQNGSNPQRGKAGTPGGELNVFCETSSNPAPPPGPTTTIGFNDINTRFMSPNGFLGVISDYTRWPDSTQKIYLNHNIAPSQDNNQFNIDLTIVQNKIPLNFYSSSSSNKTIGLMLDTQTLFNGGFIKCLSIVDSNSQFRTCNYSDMGCVCKPGTGCDPTNSDYVAIQTGCGVHCSDGDSSCNTVKWCDNYYDTEVLYNFSSGKWGGKNGCVFKKPSELFIQSAIAWRKSIGDTSGNRYLETELDASISSVTTENSDLWLKAIIGVFSTANSSMCGCKADDAECVQDCIFNSTKTVKLMVDEYNKYAAYKTGHKIKGWQFNNLASDQFNGGLGQTVDLSKFMTEIK
uniref:Uncharacterized protein n=1 Tax=viral metagenome TaxID=1070528 RepID=A0A6C0JMR5_9ZZZZ